MWYSNNSQVISYIWWGYLKNYISESIGGRLVFLFIVTTIIPMAIVFSIQFEESRKILENEIFLKLENTADLKVKTINKIFEEIEADIKTAQQYFILKTNIAPISLPPSENNEQYVIAKNQLDEQLYGFVSAKNQINDIFLLDTNGKIIYAVTEQNQNLLGQILDDSENKAFEQGKIEIYLSDVFPDSENSNIIKRYQTAPIYDFDERLVGVVAFDINMKSVYELIEDRTGLGQTGETLIGQKIGDYAVFINQLRHYPNSAFNFKVHLQDEFATPIREAVQGISNSGFTEDYRSVPIIAVWRYVPSMDWGIVAKIDSAEAFQPIEELKTTFIVISSITAIIISVIAIFASKNITTPITTLRDALKLVASGDLNIKIPEKGKDEVSELSASFNQMVIDLNKTERLKREFMMMVAHELNTPLAISIGFTQALMNRKMMGPLSEKQFKAVEKIHASTIRLRNLIGNVLDAQKLELGQMDFKINDFEVDKLLDRIEKKFRFILDEKGIKINLSKDGMIVKSDDSRIEQVLINLLLNAIEFVPKEKGLIEINVKEQDHSVIFSVKDNGPGISKDDQKQLFDKFYQVDSSLRRKHEGAGLGLAVSKGIVERLGGKIGLDSVLGAGSVFYFSVPI